MGGKQKKLISINDNLKHPIREDNIKIPTFGTFTFQTFVKVLLEKTGDSSIKLTVLVEKDPKQTEDRRASADEDRDRSAHMNLKKSSMNALCLIFCKER
ncbi:hypothetical protein EK904_006459, partial [Melospiza melodia maxima]